MTARRPDEGARPTTGPAPVPGAHDLAPPPAPGVRQEGHGRHAAVASAGRRAVEAPGGVLGDDSWQQREIERDRRRERRLVWQSLVAFAVVAALVLAGRVQGW